MKKLKRNKNIILIVCFYLGIVFCIIYLLFFGGLSKDIIEKNETGLIDLFYKGEYKDIREDNKMRLCIPVWKYSQVYNNHYYHLEKHKMNSYVLYKDMSKVGEFTLKDSYVPVSFLVRDKYAFCVVSNILEDDTLISIKQLVVKIDFDNWHITEICDLDFDKTENYRMFDDKMYQYLIFDKEFFYIIDDVDKKVFCYDLEKRKLSELKISSEMKKALPYISIIESEFVYANENAGNVDFFVENKEGQQIRICSKELEENENNITFDNMYQDNEGYVIFNNSIERNVYYDGEFFYYKKYVINKNTLECKKLKKMKCYHSGNMAFSYNKSYVYYLNELNQLERYDKKTGQIKKYGKEKYSDICANSNGCYLKLYKKGMEPGVDAGFETDDSEPMLMSWEEKTDILVKK